LTVHNAKVKKTRGVVFMSFFTKVFQRSSLIIIAAFLLLTVATVSASFVLTQSAHAESIAGQDTSAPTAPGVPATTNPTKDTTMVWNWDPATDPTIDPIFAPASGVKGYQYRFSGSVGVITDWTDTTATTATTTAPLIDDFYQLEVRAVDNAGNVGITSVGSVHLDITGPTVAITSPTSGTTVGTTKKIDIIGTSGDASSYTLSIGKTGQAPVAFTSGAAFTSYTFDTTNVPNNTYIATLTGTDAIGNTSTVEILLVVNNPVTPPAPTAPTVTVNSAKYTSRPIVITGTVSTDAKQINITILDAKGKVVETGLATFTSGNTTWSYTVKANLSNATYTVQARASNDAGYFTDAKANITVSVQSCWWIIIIHSLFSYWFF
jgi:hypothetical protein